MADQKAEPSSAESKVTSALEKRDPSSLNTTHGSPHESGADDAYEINGDLEIIGISDEEVDRDEKKQNGDNTDVKPNGHPAKQPMGNSSEAEEDLEPDPPAHKMADEGAGDHENTAVGIGSAPKKKKKKSKKPKSKRGLAAPTGFEEYYVDAPVTPAEFAEEKGLYDESRAFTERIEMAIQRYVAKRNFDSARKDLFDKYLAYGGIEAGPKMFGGLAPKDMSTMNAAEIAAQRARHFVNPDKDNYEKFVVDFEACAAAFLSSRLPVIYDLTSHPQIRSQTTIIFNFLNYLLHHDVAPEYRSQIYAARGICTLAEKELWQIVQAQKLLPGDFNTACSEIFGGIFKGLYTTSEEDWTQGVDVKSGINPETARKIFKVGLAANADKDIFERYKAQSETKTIGITSITDVAIEVTALIPATPQVLNIYSHDLAKCLKPLGILKAKTWYNPSVEDEDLTEEEEAALATAKIERGIKEYMFWVEDNVLDKCFVGMKFETTVTELSFGISYFDALFGLYCSFYQVLPNEMMYGWREPGPKLPMSEKNNRSSGLKAIGEEGWEDGARGEDEGQKEDRVGGEKVDDDGGEKEGDDDLEQERKAIVDGEHLDDEDDAELTGKAIDEADKYAEEGE